MIHWGSKVGRGQGVKGGNKLRLGAEAVVWGEQRELGGEVGGLGTKSRFKVGLC